MHVCLLIPLLVSFFGMRLNKILQEAGVASRRGADELILAGKVTVNGARVTELGTQADPKKDVIKVGNKILKRLPKKVVYILNKPSGFISSSGRQANERLVLDLFPQNEGLFTVGRLDKDAKGLLLITNDGTLAHKVIHPSSGVSKEYIVKVQSEITDEHLKRISKGTYIDSEFVRPHKVSKIRRGTLRIVLKDGKKHEVKALIAEADLPLIELKRVRVGNLRLGDLPEGSFRTLSAKEIEEIFR